MANESFTMIPNWVIRDYDFDANELLVYLALLNHRDHTTGTAYPSISTIAKESRTSPRTVRRTLPMLEQRGIIKVTRRPLGNGNNDRNLYSVGTFSRQPPVDNSRRKKGPRFESASEDPIPPGTVPPPTGSVPPPPGGSVAPKEEPPTSRTNEEDLRSELSSQRAISFDVHSPLATQQQLDYLNDLFIHFSSEIPSEHNVKQWQRMSTGEAAILIDAYHKQMPRYDEYEGPDYGDDAYSALSPKGQEWADTGFIPELRQVS
ncbi:hypothetical protein IWX78_000338 [Mycetocola sp. CAN_C7]|uniref:helix-turn-helix domain-containing protein n=1 Tax=Mycetocola sp. CAN_C7 TaxID=2787724 RepID=UPI0018CBAF4B